MLTLSIFSVILVILSFNFTFYFHSYLIQHKRIELIKKIRLLKLILIDAIENTGYVGCVKLQPEIPFVNDTNIKFDAFHKADYQPNKFTFHFADAMGIPVMRKIHDNQILLTSKVHWKSGTIVMISDCEKAELMRIDHVTHVGNLSIIFSAQPIKQNFTNHATLYLFHTWVISMHSQDKATRLLLQTDANVPHVFIDGIHAMQTTFDYDSELLKTINLLFTLPTAHNHLLHIPFHVAIRN